MLKPAYQKILYLSRPVSRRHPMSIGKRAKQFTPFAALKGFEDGIHEQEIKYEEKRILPEEKLEELDRTLRMLKEGMEVEVEYFAENPEKPGKGSYIAKTGWVEAISRQEIQICAEKIPLEAISGLSMICCDELDCERITQ